MNNLVSLLKKDVLIHQKIFLVAIYVLVLPMVMPFFLQEIFPKSMITLIISDCSINLPLVFLIFIKIDEDRFLGIPALLLTEFSREIMIFSRYLFITVTSIVSFVVSLIFSSFFLDFSIPFTAVLGTIALMLSLGAVITGLSFILSFKHFSIATITLMIVANLIYQFFVANLILMVINLALTVFFLKLSFNLFERKDF
jgi:hypothetical protein